jgi:hypothetical protein
LRGIEASTYYAGLESDAVALFRGYQELAAHVQDRLAKIDEQIAAVRLALARAYLPGLTRSELAEVEKQTGFQGFARRDPIAAMEHERHVLEVTIKQIEADERYQSREALVGASGTLSGKLAELREHGAPFEAECQRFESIEGFGELVAVGYDTPEFAERWWQPSYWKHWAWGDRVCKELGLDDFGDDVLPAYRAVAERRDFWRAEAAVVDARVQAVHDLVQRRDAAEARIPRLAAIYLEQCQEYLAEYLIQADPGLLEEWLFERGGANRAIVGPLRELAGLLMKRKYLDELAIKGLAEASAAFRARATKYARKSEKYARPKHYRRPIAEAELDRKFEAKRDKYRERIAKLRNLADRISAYDDYGRFSLHNDPELWWLEMTRKLPPRQVPSARAWYERNRDAVIAHDDWGDPDDDLDEPPVSESVAVAAAAVDLDEVGYLS